MTDILVSTLGWPLFSLNSMLTLVLVAPFRDSTDLPLPSLCISIHVQFAYHSDAALITEIFHASYFLPVSQFMNSGLRRL